MRHRVPPPIFGSAVVLYRIVLPVARILRRRLLKVIVNMGSGNMTRTVRRILRSIRQASHVIVLVPADIVIKTGWPRKTQFAMLSRNYEMAVPLDIEPGDALVYAQCKEPRSIMLMLSMHGKHACPLHVYSQRDGTLQKMQQVCAAAG